MATQIDTAADAAMARLVEVGGRATQDLGLGRMVGQIGVYMYLSDGERSLDEIAADLGLSKASVSIAARQLEALGVLARAWRQGDRRNYYRMVEHPGLALKESLMGIVRKKVQSMSMELRDVDDYLRKAGKPEGADAKYLCKRVKRARQACAPMEKLLDNPILRFLAR